MRQQHESHVDGADGWAQLDVILPEQFHTEPPMDDPERRLRLAVLEDAIRHLQRYRDAAGRRERALYEDALAWFASDDRDEPFAFVNVCDALGLDPDYMRRGLSRSYGAEGSRRSAPRFVSRRVQPRPRVARRRAA